MGDTFETIFLSSTAADLKVYREAVWKRLNSDSEFKCFAHEHVGPQRGSPAEECREKLRRCTIYVGIFSDRRGHEFDDDPARRSITELEYEWAKEFGIEIFVWMTPEHFPPSTKREADALFERQRLFRERVRKERWVSDRGFLSEHMPELKTPEQLAVEIENKLLRFRQASLITEASTQATSSDRGPTRRNTFERVDAALNTLARAGDIDLLQMTRSGKAPSPTELESKLRARAIALEADASSKRSTAAEYWRHIGSLAFLHDTLAALAAYRKAVQLDEDNIDGLRFLGELYMRLGRSSEAAEAFDQMLAVASTKHDQAGEALALLSLAWLSRKSATIERRECMVNDALRLAESANHAMLQANCYRALGLIHMDKHEFAKAKELMARSLMISDMIDDKEGTARTYLNLGNAHSRSGNFPRAEKMYREALEINEAMGRKVGIARASGNLGVVLLRQGELVAAEEALQRALAASLEISDLEGIATGHQNLGQLHKKRHDPAKACTHFTHSLHAYRKLGNDLLAADLEANLHELGCPDQEATN